MSIFIFAVSVVLAFVGLSKLDSKKYEGLQLGLYVIVTSVSAVVALFSFFHAFSSVAKLFV